MLISTNEGNPNAVKLIVAAKLAREPVDVKIVKPGGESLTSSCLDFVPQLTRNHINSQQSQDRYLQK